MTAPVWASPGKVTHLGNPPASLRAGKKFAVAFHASAAPRFWLSRDARRGGADVKLRGTVHLKGTKGAAKLTVPAQLASGSWFLLACPTQGSRGCVASKRVGVVPTPRRFAPPVTASTTLATSRAKSAKIGSGGGSLSTSSADGTRFTLSVPKGSVPDGTVVTMTPLKSLSAKGFHGSLVGGVQFGPEGLVLVHGATLTITPAHTVPLRQQVGLGYTGGGTDLQVVPLGPSTKKIQIPIAHFSGYGLGDSPSGPAGAAPPPSDNTGYYDGLGAQIMADWRDGDMSRSQAIDALRSMYVEWLKAIMQDEVPPGLSDDAAADTAVGDLLSWVRQNDLTTGDDGAFTTVRPTVIKLVQGIYHRAQQRCATSHDISEVPREIIPDVNRLALLGDDVPFSQAVQCLRFKLTVDSQVQQAQGDYNFHYTSTVEISANAGRLLPNATLDFTGSGPGTYVTASASSSGPYPCLDGPTGSSTFTLTSADGNTVTVPSLSFTVTGSSVSGYQIGLDSSAIEHYTSVVTGAGDCDGTTNSSVQQWWNGVSGSWLADGDATPAPSDADWVVVPLTATNGGGAVLAQATLPMAADFGWTGFTDLELVHDPPAAP